MADPKSPLATVPPRASSGVLFKLVIFSFALAALPLSAYFGSLKYFWNGNDIYAAITAVVAANVVLISYIVVSMLEDRSTSTIEPSEGKKNR